LIAAISQIDNMCTHYVGQNASSRQKKGKTNIALTFGPWRGKSESAKKLRAKHMLHKKKMTWHVQQQQQQQPMLLSCSDMNMEMMRGFFASAFAALCHRCV
jgi:hypothetical protein